MGPEAEPTHILNQEELVVLIKGTVKETLIQVGLDIKDPIQVQKDFQFLRDWRTTTASIRGKALLTGVGIIVLGVLGILWLGIRAVLGKVL